MALLDNGFELGVECVRAQEKVDEARARNLDLVDRIAVAERSDDLLRKLTGVTARRFCELHRDIACEIAVGRIARALDGAADLKAGGGGAQVGEFGKGVGDQFGYDAFHGAQLNQNNSIGSTSIDQRTLRAAGCCSSSGRNSRRASWSSARSLDCSSSCAR